jgi:O-antigen biosynthesis protein
MLKIIPELTITRWEEEMNEGITNRDSIVDVIVCVYNALEYVKTCLESLMAKKTISFNLILVDSGSDKETKEYLNSFAEKYNCTLFTNSEKTSYTKAANQGLKISKSEYCVLLNSDTIVTLFWLEKLIACMEFDKSTGIVGPLSNSASYQSVPKSVDHNGGTVNELQNFDISLEQMSCLVENQSEKKYPEVNNLNGFCFMIKREVINKIGYQDEVNFPSYGGEDDYCIRACQAGIKLRIADDCYVYHYKSKSYTTEQKQKERADGGSNLREKHGRDYVRRHYKEILNNPQIPIVRERIEAALKQHSPASFRHTMSILYLPSSTFDEELISIFEEVIGLCAMKVNSKIATRPNDKKLYMEHFPGIQEYCILYDHENELIRIGQHFDTVVVVDFSSIQILEKMTNLFPHIRPVYYIQEYEPYFYKNNDPERIKASKYFDLIPNLYACAKRDWICNIVKEKHGLSVTKINTSFERDMFKPVCKTKRNNKTVFVATPVTLRNQSSTEQTIAILKKLKNKYDSRVEISILGCSDEELHSSNIDLNFEFENHGMLEKEQLSTLLQFSDILVDLSKCHEFGCLVLKAMSVGCSTVLLDNNDHKKYAVHGYNCFLAEDNQMDQVLNYICKLIDAVSLRNHISCNAVNTAKNYLIEESVISLYQFFYDLNQQSQLKINSLR